MTMRTVLTIAVVLFALSLSVESGAYNPDQANQLQSQNKKPRRPSRSEIKQPVSKKKMYYFIRQPGNWSAHEVFTGSVPPGVELIEGVIKGLVVQRSAGTKTVNEDLKAVYNIDYLITYGPHIYRIDDKGLHVSKDGQISIVTGKWDANPPDDNRIMKALISERYGVKDFNPDNIDDFKGSSKFRVGGYWFRYTQGRTSGTTNSDPILGEANKEGITPVLEITTKSGVQIVPVASFVHSKTN